MRAFALAGKFPVIEAARREGRGALALMASAQTFAAFALFAAGAYYFGRRGFQSSRPRGWSNALWIAGFSVLCFTPAIYPFVTVHTIDYAVTSSRSEPAGQDGVAPRAELAAPLDAVYGAEGLNRRMSPAVFLAERGLLVAFVAAFLAVCAHDIGYRAREALEDFGVLDEPGAAPRRDPRKPGGAGPQDRKEARPKSDGPSFGHRGAFDVTAGSSGAYSAACAMLGVRLGASHREIERAYRAKMKRAHPDRGGTAERAAALNAARDTLLGRK